MTTDTNGGGGGDNGGGGNGESRLNRDEGNKIADAVHVVSATRAALDDLQSRDEAKGRGPVVTEGRLEVQEARIDACRKMRANQPVQLALLTGATVHEILAREALYDELISIRDDVADVFADDTTPGGMRARFAYGAAIVRASTGGLLDLAQSFVNALDEPDTLARAASAGATAARLENLRALHKALADADAAQNQQRGTRRATTKEKSAAFRAMTHETQSLRDIGFRAYRKDPAKREAFVSVVPHHAVKRATKSTTSTKGTPTSAAAKKRRRPKGSGPYAKKVAAAVRAAKKPAPKPKKPKAKGKTARAKSKSPRKPAAKRGRAHK